MTRRNRGDWKQEILGFFLVIVINVVVVITLATIQSMIPVSQENLRGLYGTLGFLFLGIGFVQWLYVLPLILWLRQKRHDALMRGAIASAILITFLCGGCFLIFAPMLTWNSYR